MILRTEVLLINEQDAKLIEQYENMGISAPNIEGFDLCPAIYNLGPDFEFFIKAYHVEYEGLECTELYLEGNEPIIINMKFNDFCKLLNLNK